LARRKIPQINHPRLPLFLVVPKKVRTPGIGFKDFFN
jgi:hypothetical protein